jgi:uncharacterized protein YggU (UPF0235/DUF167 family)
VDGKANDAALELLAEWLAVPRSCLSIVRGATSKIKKIFVACLEEEELAERLAKAERRESHGKDI